MSFKQKSVTTLAVLLTLLPLTGLPIVWKSGLTIAFGLSVIGLVVSDWAMARWSDAGSVDQSFKLAPVSDSKTVKTVKTNKTKTPTPKIISAVEIKPLAKTEVSKDTGPAIPVYKWPTETVE